MNIEDRNSLLIFTTLSLMATVDKIPVRDKRMISYSKKMMNKKKYRRSSGDILNIVIASKHPANVVKQTLKALPTFESLD